MAVKTGHSISGGGNVALLSMLWRYRNGAFKSFVLFLFVSNLFYFAVRFVELSNTVRRLEHEKAVLHRNLEEKTTRLVEEEKKPKPADGKPQLVYSQKKYYPYIFNEPDKCKDDEGNDLPVFLLIVIKSTTAQFDRRRSIRLTWGNESTINGVIMRRIFLVAKSDDKKKQALLERERNEYHDIIQGDFHDSFRNLTIKDIMFMRWMTTYCSQTKFIFKGDDDVFVNIDNIVDYLLSLSKDQAKDLFAGSVLYPSPRITDPKSKYYVSTNLWNEKYYPPYVSGGGFVMSSLVSKKIFEVTKVTPIIPIDDAFLGVCLKKLGMKPQNHKGFKSWGVNRPKDICIYHEIMTLHKLNSEEMVDMWKKLHSSDFNDCAKSFKVSRDDEKLT
uniref:Hexosyltransferase n=1 Tax=Phallusia mammillata TaxID=59560 RepID=A0A6F9D7U3_9ASCI|nr:beta-1,3-galactosyltransferase 1-like [Phallusia mammillata]